MWQEFEFRRQLECRLWILPFHVIRARVCIHLRSPGIDSAGWESIPGLLSKRFTNSELLIQTYCYRFWNNLYNLLQLSLYPTVRKKTIEIRIGVSVFWIRHLALLTLNIYQNLSFVTSTSSDFPFLSPNFTSPLHCLYACTSTPQWCSRTWLSYRSSPCVGVMPFIRLSVCLSVCPSDAFLSFCFVAQYLYLGLSNC
jgi:hypothetical protein